MVTCLQRCIAVMRDSEHNMYTYAVIDSGAVMLGRSVFLPPGTERQSLVPILAIYVPAHAVP